MALDEPNDNDVKLEQEGYTLIVDPHVTAMVGDITVEKHRWGGLLFTTSNGGASCT